MAIQAEKLKFRNFTEFGTNMNFEPSSRPVFELPSRHLLYWLGNILKVCTVYYTSECSIDSFERTDSPWERIEKWIEQIEKTPGDDNVVVETNHHWFNHTGISNTLKIIFIQIRTFGLGCPRIKVSKSVIRIQLRTRTRTQTRILYNVYIDLWFISDR